MVGQFSLASPPDKRVFFCSVYQLCSPSVSPLVHRRTATKSVTISSCRSPSWTCIRLATDVQPVCVISDLYYYYSPRSDADRLPVYDFSLTNYSYNPTIDCAITIRSKLLNDRLTQRVCRVRGTCRYFTDHSPFDGEILARFYASF